MPDWFEQTQVLVGAVAEAQQKMWDGWLNAARSSASPGGSVPAGDRPEGATGAGAEAGNAWSPVAWPAAWQDMGRLTMDMWAKGSGGVPREVAERLFAGQEAFLRFVDFALGSLRVVAPKIDTGEDWVELLRRYLDQVKEEMVTGSAWLSPEGITATAASGPELWRLYQTELSQFLGPWAGFVQRLPLEMADIASGDRTAVSRMQMDFTDTFETAFGRYLATPALGYNRELQEKTFRGFEAWSDFRRAAQEFQDEFLNTGFASYEGLLRELVERGERGEAITSFRELFDLWVDMGERSYAGLFSTEGFAQVQGRMVNAAMVYELRQREVLEEVQNLMNLPTRREIDQVHRHVHDLRIEVRYMKRDMAALRRVNEEQAAALAKPAPEPAAANAVAAEPAAAEPAPVAPAPAEPTKTVPTAAAPAKTTRAGAKAPMAPAKAPSKKTTPAKRPTVKKKSGAAPSGE